MCRVPPDIRINKPVARVLSPTLPLLRRDACNASSGVRRTERARSTFDQVPGFAERRASLVRCRAGGTRCRDDDFNMRTHAHMQAAPMLKACMIDVCLCPCVLCPRVCTFVRVCANMCVCVYVSKDAHTLVCSTHSLAHRTWEVSLQRARNYYSIVCWSDERQWGWLGATRRPTF